jgi:1-acyl-sn-glycerol-3-phosphate acyltransferase
MKFYDILKPVVKIGVKYFFKKIYFHNAHNIPKDKPVLIASNHPSVFLEPTIMAVTLPRPVHSMVRGNVFEKKFYSLLLKSLNMIPIFRMKEGYSNLKNNQETFKTTDNLLRNGEQILIFSEGFCYQEKRLRPLQKGTARMAFGAIENSGIELDIHIVPCGVNYTFQRAYRDTVMIEYGAPIRVLDYWDQYLENNNRGIVALTQALAAQMKPLIVHIEHKEDEEVTEQLLILQRNTVPQSVFPIVERSNTLLRYERRTAKAISEMPEDDKNNLKIEAHKYHKTLKDYKIDDFGIQNSTSYNGAAWLVLVIGFVPFLIGYIFSWPYVRLGKYIADSKSEEIEYYASVWFSVTKISSIFYFIIWLLVTLIAQNWYILGFVLLMPFLGFYSLLYFEFKEKCLSAKRVRNNIDAKLLGDLKKQRDALLAAVEI